jgi:predicted glycosyltransferase involved in capsule biosynthesis
LAKGEFLAFIDSDCVIGLNYFNHALDIFTHLNPDATGSRVILPNNPCWIERSWYALHEKQSEGFVNYINSGNFLIKRSVFECVGGFDDDLTASEDTEIGNLEGARHVR